MEDSGELVLRVGMPARAALNNGGFGRRGCLTPAAAPTYTGLQSVPIGTGWVPGSGGPGSDVGIWASSGEDADELGGELVEVVLHWAELPASIVLEQQRGGLMQAWLR